MAPTNGRRRRTHAQEDSDSDPSPPQTQRRRQRARDSSDEEIASQEASENDADADASTRNSNSTDQVVKKLVRYALACEYQRTPIRRALITEKVIGPQRGMFRKVFEMAQQQLRHKFGMEMVELPAKERVTLKEKRAAQKSKSGGAEGKATGSYILVTILPSAYRVPEIVPPSNIGSEEEEARYVGFCTTVVTMISLSPNQTMTDHKLLHSLERLNADKNTGLGLSTPDLLKKMAQQGYVLKIQEKTEDSDTIDWKVGARGKVEVGNKGVRGFVKEIYGERAPEDLDKRLQRSLGMDLARTDADGDVEMSVDEDPGSSTQRRGRRRNEDDE